MDFYTRLCSLIKEKGLSQNKVEKALGFGNGAISKWKTYTPNAIKVQKVADYIGVSYKYLLTGKEEENKTDEEYAVIAGKVMSEPALMDMIDDYMLLDDADKANVRQLILSLSKKNRD